CQRLAKRLLELVDDEQEPPRWVMAVQQGGHGRGGVVVAVVRSPLEGRSQRAKRVRTPANGSDQPLVWPTTMQLGPEARQAQRRLPGAGRSDDDRQVQVENTT